MILPVVIAVAVAYVLWSIVHHARSGDLHPKVVLEYVGIAILGVAIVWSVLLFI